ncbi:hypothetical protein Lac2_21290 [Claveliimonas bilis]|uniref:Uncharacterized protein n=1 Tax=Claveliimonas bilis TaxID=3028070 RepID=A0ABN6YX19_9FIRM|nr:hypothetical protein [Claveliimonas bilis]BDZ75879.1 hypothetical protein Lac1_00620 [Claveliimonas bilis]BDZ83995.1 hypothetical protein Lac2_21290 [Claveliimonas bilis]
MSEKKKLPQTEEIARYIEEMEIRKKVIGGWEEEDVLEHIRIISGKYEEVIRSLQAKIEEQAEEEEERKKEYGKKSTELIDSMAQIREYREHMLGKAKEEAEEILKAVREQEKEGEERIRELKVMYEKERQEYQKKAGLLKEQGRIFSENARKILEEIEALHDGME